MALPTYDSTKHHIGLKQTGTATLYGFMLEGGFVKEVQRESQGAPEFGGQTDLIGQAPSLSRWTQDDFVGGMFGFQWGRDDAMFADCTGFMPNQQSRSVISCPPMVLKKALTAGATVRSMFMVAGSIYIAAGGTLYRYRIDTDATTQYDLPSGDSFIFAEYDSVDQKIWALQHVPGSLSLVRRINTDLTDPTTDSAMLGPNNTSGWSTLGGTIFNQFIVVQYGRKIFIGDPPENSAATTDGKIKWRKMKRLPGRWKDSIAWNNVLYILINDGSFKSHIFAFDGDDITAVCTFPFNFFAKCIVEYAGRLFVGGTGTDVNGGEHYAELYEVTGASVRLVRSFSPETRNQFLGGVAGEWPTSFDDLVIHEGLLWMCQKGKKMIAYDITSDGFFGAAEIQDDSAFNVVKMVGGRGRLWAHATGATEGIYRIAQPADTIDAWNPTLITSDFTYEIAKTKRWSEIVVMSKYGPLESLEYSVNGGDTWTALTVTTEQPTSGKVYFGTASLSGITPSRIIRFRIKLDADTPDSAVTYHRELIAFTVSFSMLDTTKKAWAITINGSEIIETRDAEFAEATVQTYTVAEIRDQLWSWQDNKTPLTFRDVNGDEYSVAIEAFREVQPVVGPNATGESEPEAHYALTLLEV